MVFGSSGAEDAYSSVIESTNAKLKFQSVEIPALPSPCSCGGKGEVVRSQQTVSFVGALEPRKGIDILLGAWAIVRDAFPLAQLQIAGGGPLEALVQKAADGDHSISYLGTLTRARVHGLYRATAIVVLPSQRNGRWREQIGLSIVEGLAHNCRILASEETGLARWLEENGHSVIEAPTSVDALASAVIENLRSSSMDLELADLPSMDGRIAADEWLTRASVCRVATEELAGTCE
ncbi:hypothetical protein NCCP2145_21770 [Pseudarthrobacter sp. NCCP-2145]|nr:hypothetical protein NCCP2145_21770 [Pseudarthrobacter sp. NCCP-2145]